MADKAPPPSPDQNILVYVPDYQVPAKNVSVPNPIGHQHRSCGTFTTTSRGQPPFVAFRTYENTTRNVESVVVRSEAAESTVSNDSSTSSRDTETPPDVSVAPPFGWKRILANGVIIYISPSNTALSSSEQVKSYLLTDGTCKCGLECPVNCDVTFNFNPKVLTRPWTAPTVAPGDLTKLCNHKRKVLLQTASLDALDNRYDGLRRKKRRVGAPQPSVSQLLSQREQTNKEQQLSYNGFPWKEGSTPQIRGMFTNGYQEENLSSGSTSPLYKFEGGNTALPVQYQRVHNGPRFPSMAQVAEAQPPLVPVTVPQQVTLAAEQLRPLQTYGVKIAKTLGRSEVPAPEPVAAQPLAPGLAVNRTPPWQQNKQAAGPATYERVPPLHSYGPSAASTSWNVDKKKLPQPKLVRKRFSEEEAATTVDVVRNNDQPSFMDDPSGYLAQQTALLNSTISRQNANSPSVEGVPLATNVNKYSSAMRPKSRNASRFPDSSLEKKKMEEPSSTHPDRSPDDRGQIQGATVSSSNRSPVMDTVSLGGTETPSTIVTTMASGHTVSSNTITSVLAGRANTATVTINNLQKPPPGDSPPVLARAPSQGSSMSLSPAGSSTSQEPQHLNKSGSGQQHIIMSTNGQLIVTNSSLLSSQQQANVQKITAPSSPGPSQIGVSSQVLNQPAVLVNTLPGPLLLQPSVAVMDGLNTVQIPQIVGNQIVQNQVVDDAGMLSPDSKRKAASLKRRKLSPTVGNTTMLLSPQGTNNVVVQQPQQLNTGQMLQALTILPSKTNFGGAQQLITTNMLQPLNLVQNFPIQQFLVPAGVSGMVMSDGSILQDTVQLNVLTPVQNAGVFSGGQNLLTPGMVIRAPNSQSSSKVIQNNQFLSSPNQFVVNNTFGGQLSPMLNVSPTQCGQSQEYVPQNVMVQQPNTSNTTVLQQNTTIVQQTTTVSNQQTHPSSTLNLNQNFILNEKPNFILTADKQNFILGPDNEKILINPDNLRGNYLLGNSEKQNYVINNVDNKQNLMINSVDKSGGFIVDKKNSVSTQTQNQVLQISSSPALVVATNSAVYNTSSSYFSGSPPDTTTLSPIDQEVTTSCLTQPLSPGDPSSSSSCPMVHCISSSSQQEDGPPFMLDSYNGNAGKSYPESSDQTMLNKDDDYDVKTSLCNVPDSILAPSSESGLRLKEEL